MCGGRIIKWERRDKLRSAKTIHSLLEEYEKSKTPFKEYRLRKYLRKIPDQTLIEQIGMAEMPKIIHILRKKYRRNVRLIPLENDLMLRIGKTNAANMSYLAIYLHFLTVSKQTIRIEGNLSVPTGLGDTRFYVRINGRRSEVVLADCGLDLFLGDEIYEKRTVFCLEIPLSESRYQIEFFNLINGVECRYSRINAMRFSPIADQIRGQYYEQNGWITQISGNKILCHRADAAECEKYESNFQRELMLLAEKDAHWAACLRQSYFRERNIKKKPVWLIMDRCDRADDNGETFFRYMQRHREIETFFIIDGQCEDYKRLQTVGTVVPLYSEKHYLLTLLADFVISSQCNGYAENPFWEKAEYFRDLYHRPQLIFLQHGVIKDDMSGTLNRFHTNLRGFITSTEAEYRSILNYPYYYGKKNVWLTGLPILDELRDMRQGYVVVAPTWRMGLMRQQWNQEKKEMQWIPNTDIPSSEYYKTYKSLFMDRKLRECCKKYGYKLAFKPHPLMEPYLREMIEDTDAIWMGAEVSYRDMLSMGNLLVTDYSSIAFEFAYLGKSTVYFQFDRKNFFASHTYRKGYFDYVRDGFGEVCFTEKRLVKVLTDYMKNGCAVKEKYKDRIQRLYTDHGGACERIYERLKNAAEQER